MKDFYKNNIIEYYYHVLKFIDFSETCQKAETSLREQALFNNFDFNN